MELTGKRLSPGKAIHLLDYPDQNKSTWLTLCGRKLRRDYALSDEKFDSGTECCVYCVQQIKKIKSRKPLPEAILSGF